MQEVQNITFALLRYALCGTEIPDKVSDALTEERLKGVYQLLKMHDLAHLAFDGLQSAVQKIGQAERGAELVKTEVYGMFRRQQQLAVYRYEQKIYEFEQICNVLEEACIPYVPLKGAVLKDLYPQPWMRTSCDIDILVSSENLGKAIEALKTRLHYEMEGKHSHDVSLYAENGVHLELHYDLIEDYIQPISGAVLSAYWNTSESEIEGEYKRKAQPEMFYFYHIAHMAKHFEHGGCGIRPFIDLWFLTRQAKLDEGKKDELLAKGGLAAFERAAKQLSEVWLSCQEHDELTLRLQTYILRGGVYGQTDNWAAIRMKRKGSRFRYFMSQIFIPYDHLKVTYKVLEKHKWMYPFCMIARCVKLLFRGPSARMKKELKYTKSKHVQQETAKLLSDLGL